MLISCGKSFQGNNNFESKKNSLGKSINPQDKDGNILLNDYFGSEIKDIKKAANGNFWMLRDVKENSSSLISSTLELWSNKFKQIKKAEKIPLKKGDSIAKFEVHPSQEISIVIFTPNEKKDNNSFNGVKIARLTTEGNFDFVKRPTFNNEHAYDGSVDAITNGNDLILTECTQNSFVTHYLDQNYNIKWSYHFSTADTPYSFAFYYPGVYFTVKTEIEDNKILVYHIYKDNLIQVHELDLAGHETNQYIIDVNLKKSHVISKIYLSPTNLYIFSNNEELYCLDKKTKNIIWNKKTTASKNGLTTVSSLLEANNILLIGGSTSYDQVSTGSVTKYGKKFVTKIDLETGESLEAPLVYQGKRNGKVNVLFQLENGQIIMGGIENGPKTHDGDNDPEQNFQHSFLRFMK